MSVLVLTRIHAVMNPFASATHGALQRWQSQSPVVRGILLMCLSTVVFSIMHASVRFVSSDLPPFQIAFFRNLFGLAFLVPFLVGAGFAQLRARRLGLHAVRGLVNVCAMLMFFSSLAITPLATVTALSFTAPIFAAVLSFLVLRERFQIYRWAAIIAGFVGMLIILRPGFVSIEFGAVLAAGAAALWAVAMIIIKILSRTDSSVAIVAWMGIFLCAFSIGPALWVWQTPTPSNLGWLAFIGLCGSIAQVFIEPVTQGDRAHRSAAFRLPQTDLGYSTRRMVLRRVAGCSYICGCSHYLLRQSLHHVPGTPKSSDST